MYEKDPAGLYLNLFYPFVFAVFEGRCEQSSSASILHSGMIQG